MLGTDDDDQAPEEDSGPDDGMEQLAVAAEGDSVSVDRLRGNEQYFPDCRSALQEGQQPHHLILLTTSGTTFEASVKDAYGSGNTAGTYLQASEGGVALLTEKVLLAIVDGATCEVPYGTVQGSIYANREIEIHGTGHVNYVLHTALSADQAEVAAAYDCLRRMIREYG